MHAIPHLTVTLSCSSFGDRWTTWKFREIVVTDITEVVNPDLACIETVGSNLTDEGKEPDALGESRIFLDVCAVCDKVEDLVLLIGGGLQIKVAVLVLAH